MMPLADKWGDGDGSWGELVADLHSLDAEMAQLRDALSDLIGPAEASTWALDKDEPDDYPTWQATWEAIEAARKLLNGGAS